MTIDLLAAAVFVLGAVLVLSAARPLLLHSRVARTARSGRVEPLGSVALSPLNEVEAVYCAWAVRRRLLVEGLDDEVRGEEAALFRVCFDGGDAVDVDLCATLLHLSPARADAWTSRWDGLRPTLQRALRQRLEGTLDQALYHCQQVVIEPGQPVTLCTRPGLLTDLTPGEARRWAMHRALRRAVPGLLLLSVGAWLTL